MPANWWWFPRKRDRSKPTGNTRLSDRSVRRHVGRSPRTENRRITRSLRPRGPLPCHVSVKTLDFFDLAVVFEDVGEDVYTSVTEPDTAGADEPPDPLGIAATDSAYELKRADHHTNRVVTDSHRLVPAVMSGSSLASCRDFGRFKFRHPALHRSILSIEEASPQPIEWEYRQTAASSIASADVRALSWFQVRLLQ